MLAGQIDLILDFLGLSGTGQFHDPEGIMLEPGLSEQNSHDREGFGTAGGSGAYLVMVTDLVRRVGLMVCSA